MRSGGCRPTVPTAAVRPRRRPRRAADRIGDVLQPPPRRRNRGGEAGPRRLGLISCPARSEIGVSRSELEAEPGLRRPRPRLPGSHAAARPGILGAGGGGPQRHPRGPLRARRAGASGVPAARPTRAWRPVALLRAHRHRRRRQLEATARHLRRSTSAGSGCGTRIRPPSCATGGRRWPSRSSGATGRRPLGLARRRRFVSRGGNLLGLDDEHFSPGGLDGDPGSTQLEFKDAPQDNPALLAGAGGTPHRTAR